MTATMTGRRENALDNSNPAAAHLARLLRALRAAVGNPSYRTMAPIAHYSASALSLAANGRVVPTWDVTKAYLRACGVHDDAELIRWRRQWDLARSVERSGDSAERHPYLVNASFETVNSTEIDVLVSAMGVLPTVPQKPIETDLTEIKDLGEFRGALKQLKEAFELSLRDIERRSTAVTGPLPYEGRKGRDPDSTTTLPRSVINDMLNGRSSLIPRTVNIYLSACGLPQDEVGTWLRVLYRLRAEETRVAAARRVLQEHTGDVGALFQALSEITAASMRGEAPDPDPARDQPQQAADPSVTVSYGRQPDQRGRHRRESRVRIWLLKRVGRRS